MGTGLDFCSDRERLFAKYIQIVLAHRARGDVWAVAEFVSRLRRLDVDHAVIEQALDGDAAQEAKEILEAMGKDEDHPK